MTTIKPAIRIAAEAAVAARTEELFRQSGALREGHLQLEDGRHSDAYVDTFAVLSDPAATSELCSFWAARYAATRVDLVAGPTTCGAILAFETGRQLGTRGTFAGEASADGTTRREFSAPFTIQPGERVLLVDEMLTTGGTFLAMLSAIEAQGGEIVGCEVLIDRSGGRAAIESPRTGRSYPFHALWHPELPTFEPGPATCPKCAAGVPLEASAAGGVAQG